MQFLTCTDFLTRSCTDGLAAVYPDLVQTLPGSFNGRALLRKPVDKNRVNLIVSAGGGGGPFSDSFVTSPDLADAAVNGGMYAAPSAYDIYEVAKEIDSPHGYFLLYNNFMGDCLNNDMALELLRMDKYDGRLCPVCDDLLSAPADAPRSERTGLIGILYSTRIAASCARQGAALDELSDMMAHVNNRMSTVTITFDFEKKLTMFGEGISGEPAPLVYENKFTIEDAAQIAYDLLYEDLKPKANEKIFILVNRSFPTAYEDEYSLCGALNKYAAGHTPIYRMSAGYYLYMSSSYGFSVTMLCADERIAPHLEKRVHTDSFTL